MKDLVNFDTIFAIIGFVISLYLGYLGLKYTLKYRKKTEIIFLRNSSIALFETIVKNLDDLEINFQGKKISENLILFKGSFFNSGNIDIEKNIIHQPLEIDLPENYSWVRYKLIDSSRGLQVATKLIGNKLIFEWDLFKVGEFFTFDSLIEVRSIEGEDEEDDLGRSLLDNVMINHRITDLKNIEKVRSVRKPVGGGLLIVLTVLVSFLVGACIFASTLPFSPMHKAVSEIKQDSLTYYGTVEALGDSLLELTEYNGDRRQTIHLISASSIIGDGIKIEKVRSSYWFLLINLLGLAYVGLWFAIIRQHVRERRLYGKLKHVAESHNDSDSRWERGWLFRYWLTRG